MSSARTETPADSPGIRERHQRLADRWLAEHGDGSLAIERSIGCGGFSSCWLLRSATSPQDNNQLALKLIDRSGIKASKQECIKRELSIHSKLRHANIVEFYRYAMHHDLVLIFMEYCPAGNLSQRIKAAPLSEAELRPVCRQLLSALAYVHSQHVLHRDIKPANVLLCDAEARTVKLADFGLSIRLRPGDTVEVHCGTPYYFSPEMVNDQPYGYPADMWSFGVLLFACFVGRVPFYGHGISRQEIFERIRNQPIVYPRNMSRGLADVLSRLLCREPEHRDTTAKLLRHAWLRD